MYRTDKTDLIKKVFETTGSPEFVSAFVNEFPDINFQKVHNEEETFKQARIQYIPSYMRETEPIISIASKNEIPVVIQPDDIKWIIHCHSNWSNGNLDYSESILTTFDLVIASVHSNLKMNEEKAMMRLLKAIENPYTTILGHMTGRLSLSRKGYLVDHKKLLMRALQTMW